MRRLLIGIHDKNCSLRAVTYVMRHYREARDVDVTLIHVIPDLPATYWDDGHILSPAEEAERNRVIATWTAKQRQYIEPILGGAVHELVSHGLPAQNVRMKVLLARGGGDIADNLLDEARETGCQTIVVGRCGIADGKHFMAGGVVSRLIHKAAGVAICVVQ